jgi:hypothetical protein
MWPAENHFEELGMQEEVDYTMLFVHWEMNFVSNSITGMHTKI